MGTSSCALAMTGMPLCSHYMGYYSSNRTHGASNSNAYYNCNVSHKLFKVITEINHHFLVQRNDSIKVMHQSGLNSPESCLFCLAKLHVPLHHLQHVLRLIIRQTREIQFTAHPRLTKYLSQLLDKNTNGRTRELFMKRVIMYVKVVHFNSSKTYFILQVFIIDQ